MLMDGGRYFLTWPEAFTAGVAVVGGKGWNLGRLARYGFKIPVGGVVAAVAYCDFLQANGLREDIEGLSRKITLENIGDRETEENLALLREKIKAGQWPEALREELVSGLKTAGILNKPVAVRSSASAEDSAGASFAGIHDSFLNVRGTEDILSAVKACYASLWTPRSVTYRRKLEISDDEVVPAVAIMEMVRAEAAGIGFSCDPRNGRQDVLVISANFGLGESVVGGAAEPDEYCLDTAPWFARPVIREKRNGRKEGMSVIKDGGGTEFISSAGLAGKQVLTDEQIVRLGSLIIRVYEALEAGEAHQDIEWVYDGRDFLLVQARPVTVMPRCTFEELRNQPDIWSNGNYRDAVPMVVSTLGRGLLKQN